MKKKLIILIKTRYLFVFNFKVRLFHFLPEGVNLIFGDKRMMMSFWGQNVTLRAGLEKENVSQGIVRKYVRGGSGVYFLKIEIFFFAPLPLRRLRRTFIIALPLKYSTHSLTHFLTIPLTGGSGRRKCSLTGQISSGIKDQSVSIWDRHPRGTGQVSFSPARGSIPYSGSLTHPAPFKKNL